ncbi:hypothetical protein [Amycolatopsis sp. PS_44_ISF1]|uniref:hypothetical protein n=1 Tax=Amycolatopsis sp. PS_44_ISF1 TaxID=2974917 RepID=UPI0028DF4769|nr:hypothetical protein [Amycolatopsis sp. PS_44_ISF1]MDT8914416.1 hypothetical protein [Amycolatopsis sp. PS_44_ISF1]
MPAARANPVRIALAPGGAQSGTALQETAALRLPGQLDHHLKALTGASRWSRTGAVADVTGPRRPGVRNPGG